MAENELLIPPAQPPQPLWASSRARKSRFFIYSLSKVPPAVTRAAATACLPAIGVIALLVSAPLTE